MDLLAHLSSGKRNGPWVSWTVEWFLEVVVAGEIATMTLQVSSIVYGCSGDSKDNYHGLTGR